MEILIGLGAVISVIGIVGIILSIVQVRRAKRDAKNDEDLRAQIQKAMPLNLASFLFSVLGLMCVVMGLFLG